MTEKVTTRRLTVAPLRPSDADDLGDMLMKGPLYDVIGGAPESRVAALERIGRWTAGTRRTDMDANSCVSDPTERLLARLTLVVSQ